MFFDIVCLLDRRGTLDEIPLNEKKFATGLLLHKFNEEDFAGPLSSRASKVLGPISRHRVADILLHMNLASRASRPGLTCWYPTNPLYRAVHCSNFPY